MARHASSRKRRRPSGKVTAVALVVLALVAAGAVFLILETSATSTHPQHLSAALRPEATTTTTSTVPPTTTTTTRPAGPGFNAGQITAVGDSVMLDYQADLEADVPGVDVEAAVSRQWATGEQILQELRSEGRLGAVVVVALGTNGPITSADFDAMMSILAGARVVFVTIVVDRPWQNPNN
jgi:hypothetical protein